MDNRLFKKLSRAEVERFIAAARERYTPGEEVYAIWHPCYRMECERMNFEVTQRDGADE